MSERFLADERGLAEHIKNYWQHHCPALYRDLERQGRLDRQALGRARLAREYAEVLQRRGCDVAAAERKAFDNVALLVWE